LDLGDLDLEYGGSGCSGKGDKARIVPSGRVRVLVVGAYLATAGDALNARPRGVV